MSGKVLWQSDKPNHGLLFGGPLMLGGGRVYSFGSADGLYGADITTGEFNYYNEDVRGTVFGIESYGDRFVVLSMSNSSLNIFNPATGRYDLQFKSPHHNPSQGRQFFLNSFMVDTERQWIAAHDYEYTYIFDVAGY
jgi:hypothetical protein